MPHPHTLHTQQAELNETAAKIAAQSECYDWAVTMCFYAALHYVEAHAVFNHIDINTKYEKTVNSSGTVISQHQRRIAYLEDISYDKNGLMLDIKAYKKLLKASMKARYMDDIRCYSRKYFHLSFNSYFQNLSIIKELVKI